MLELIGRVLGPINEMLSLIVGPEKITWLGPPTPCPGLFTPPPYINTLEYLGRPFVCFKQVKEEEKVIKIKRREISLNYLFISLLITITKGKKSPSGFFSQIFLA